MAEDAAPVDFIDPAPSPRLSRKSLIGVALAGAGVILVLFFGSRGGGGDGGGAGQPPPEPLAYGGVPPIAMEEDSPIPPPPTPPAGNPWGNAAAPDHWGGGPGGETAKEVEERQQLFEQARKAPTVLYEAAPETATPAPADGPDAEDGLDMEALYRDALAPLAALGSPATPAPGPPGWESTTTGVPVGYGNYVVRQGSVIHAALETTVNSDRPGPVIGRVVRPVRDSKTFRHVLIPAGTKLIGAMQNTPTGFRNGVVVAWTRLQFSDGRVADLPGFPSTETTGGQGVSENVDKHRMGRFGAATLLALMGAGTTYATAQAASSTTGLPGAALGVELARMGSATAARRIQRRPTVTVSPGYRFLIYVSDDMHFQKPSAL